jgi:hypothetical protein
MKKTTKNTKKNTNYINTAEIGKKLHQHLAERARLQQQHDELWVTIKRWNCNRSSEMHAIDAKIGANTFAIDKLIGQLVRASGRYGKAHDMAIGYLKSEIARNQKIAAKREKLADDVDAGRTHYICADGTVSTSTSDQRKYVAAKKKKIASHQKMLSQLLAMQRRAA